MKEQGKIHKQIVEYIMSHHPGWPLILVIKTKEGEVKLGSISVENAQDGLNYAAFGLRDGISDTPWPIEEDVVEAIGTVEVFDLIAIGNAAFRGVKELSQSLDRIRVI